MPLGIITIVKSDFILLSSIIMSIHKTALRLPKDLHQQILEASKESGISMNAEIVTRLKISFNSDKEEKERVEKIVANYLKKQGLIEGDKTT